MIRNTLAVLLVAASLTACASGGGVASPGTTPPVTSPSPTLPSNPSRTAEAIDAAFRALDLAASSAELAIQAGVLEIGSPRALAIADGLESAKTALNAAVLAQRVNDAFGFNTQIEQAKAAMARVSAALASVRKVK